LSPSAKILADNPEVTIDISKIPEGEAKRVKWHNLPVIVLHRTKMQIAQISKLNSLRAKSQLVTSVPDPIGLIPEYRSIRPEVFVVYRWTGNAVQCGSNYTPSLDLYPSVNGGFLEMCRGAWHDVAGRLLKQSWLEGGDLPIPPYKFLTGTTIVIGPADEHV